MIADIVEKLNFLFRHSVDADQLLQFLQNIAIWLGAEEHHILHIYQHFRHELVRTSQ